MIQQRQYANDLSVHQCDDHRIMVMVAMGYRNIKSENTFTFQSGGTVTMFATKCHWSSGDYAFHFF